MNILITGHSGFLGDHTARYLKKWAIQFTARQDL